MKRIVSLVLAALLLCGCLPMMAQAEDLQDVYCAEQDFSTKIPADKTAAWEEDTGLRISVGKPGYVPYVTVYRRAAADKFKNPVNYLNNIYREYMEESYDNKVGTNPCKTKEIGGKQLYSANYHYEVKGNKLCVTLMIEVRDDGDVEYHVKYVEGKGDEAMAVAETAVRYYQTGSANADDGAPVADGLKTVRCEKDGFSTKIPEDAVARVEDDGIFYVWLKDEGYVPNVYVVRRTKKLNNPENYVRNVYTNFMKETFGDNLKATTQYEQYEIGGKQLLGASYVYKAASGANINQLFLVEVRADRDVEYTARYLNSERESTLAALDAVVRYYRPDGEQAAAPAPAAKPATVSRIVTGTRNYSDSRFSMKVPTGWQIKTFGEYMDFGFKAWDPANPNRTIFMTLKLEPFLKSQAAKAKYQEVARQFGGTYTYFADAPVLEWLTLPAFLKTMPDLYNFCDKYNAAGLTASPSLIPNMADVSVLDTCASKIPCNPSCPDNSIAYVSFNDFLGQPCEGIVTAQPTDSIAYDFFGVDGWFYTVYQFMGVTAPKGEMQDLAPILTECLGSFSFERSYVNLSVDLSNDQTQALLAQGELMQAAHDAMVNAWYTWEK